LIEHDDADEVVADLTDVSFLDSAGIRSIVEAHRWLTERSVTLTLANPSPFVRRVLTVTALDTLIPVRG
jgi:anti-anti-sigma factor